MPNNQNAMKVKTVVTVALFVALILTSCVSATISVPTETAIPTLTVTPVLPTLTITPTPIPTLAGIYASVPDPRYTNPELFDLQKPSAPISQFINAMKMAGIEITPKEVNDNLSFKELKDKDGNPFIVAVYYLDPDLNKQGETLEGNIPILTASNDGNQFVWKFGYRTLADNGKLNFGSVMMGWMLDDPKYKGILQKDFNSMLIDAQTNWFKIEAKQGIKNYAPADEPVRFGTENEMSILGQSLIWGYTGALPNWLTEGKFTRDQYIEFMKAHITDTMQKYNGKIKEWVVVNEAHWMAEEDFFKAKIGDDYVEMAFQTARDADPSAKLLYSDFQNETDSSLKTAFNKQIVEKLKAKNLIDGIGLHMRADASNPPQKADLIKTMQSYGIPVYVTELDVDLSKVTGDNSVRFYKQAEIYKTILEASLESGVCNGFYVFEVGDQYSWLETDLGRTKADPTLFDDNFNPKIAYYVIGQTLYEHLP